MCEALPEIGADGVVITRQVARAYEEIDEIKLPGPCLERLVSINRLDQLGVKAGSEIGIGCPGEPLQTADDLRMRFSDIRKAERTLPVGTVSLAIRVPKLVVPCEVDQAGLDAVVVAAPDRLGRTDSVAQPPCLPHASIKPVLRIRTGRGGVGKFTKLPDERVDFVLAIEWIPTPERPKVSPFGQPPPRIPQPRRRARVGFLVRVEAPGARRAPERSAHSFGRVFEDLLQPEIESLAVQPLRVGVEEDFKMRIDPRLDRALAKQIRTEAVDRADMGFFEMLESMFKVPTPIRDSGFGILDLAWVRGTLRAEVLAGLLEALTQAKLELAGSLLGKRDGYDLIDVSTRFRQDVDDTVDELGRLAGAGCSFDDERFVERRTNSLAVAGVD